MFNNVNLALPTDIINIGLHPLDRPMVARSLDSKSVSYSFASYNKHGYRQGFTLLKELICNTKELNIDFIFIQENWLTPQNLYKMDAISDVYTFFGKSAMETAVSTSVLRGRTWGGVGFLIRQDLCKKQFYFQNLRSALLQSFLIDKY